MGLPGGYGRGLVNSPGPVASRILPPVRRFSLMRTLLMLFGTRFRSIASHMFLARSGASASAKRP